MIIYSLVKILIFHFVVTYVHKIIIIIITTPLSSRVFYLLRLNINIGGFVTRVLALGLLWA